MTKRKRQKKRKPVTEYLVLVAGRVEPQTKTSLLRILEHKKWTESQYVREAVVEKVERDLSTLGSAA